MLRKNSELFSLLILNCAIYLLFFYPVITQLNSVLLSSGGDGIKNYFTYLYFIHFDKGVLFTGMNYPFGEHMVFTDNMPLLAWPIAQFRAWFPGIVQYGLLFMHLSFILSYFLASVFVYKILKLYNLKGWWAIVSAIFIAYFSPQFLRISGHFGLALSCYLPMLMYWIMQYERQRKIKYLLYIFLVATLFTFLHVYYLAFGLVLVAAYAASYLIVTRKRFLPKLRYLVPLLLPVVAAVLVFKIFLKLTDTVTDRPAYPIGYLGAGVTGEDILTSNFNIIGANVFRVFFGRAASGSEGYTYLGLISILCCLFLAWRIIRSITDRIKTKKRLPTHPLRPFRVWLLAGFFVLLFSMGVPFVWGLDFLVDYFSVFRQFRTIGRFAWIFYYVMMIYSAAFLYRLAYLRRKDRKSPAYIAVVLGILVVYGIELGGYAGQLHAIQAPAKDNYNAFFSREEDSWKTWLGHQGYPVEQFQGLIGLPYFHIGSEKLGLQEPGYEMTMYYGSQIALQTHLGMMNVMMSRTSWSQSFESVQFFDGPFTPKKISTGMDTRPFLVFVNTSIPKSEGELYLLRYARFIGNRSGFDFYSFKQQDMIKGDRVYTDSCSRLALQQAAQEGLLPPDNRFRYSQHFDELSGAVPFMGKGALQAGEENQQLFLTIDIKHPTADTAFVLSAWMHCFDGRPEMSAIIYEQLDAAGAVIATHTCLANASTYPDHSWFKTEQMISIQPGTQKIRLYAKGGKKEFIALDEVLLRPAGSIYFYKTAGPVLMLNNRPVMIKKTL